ncbi:MAG: YciI family protein [Pseudomonadota bacterium]
MKYLLLNCMNETAMLNLPKEEAGRMHADYLAYVEAMRQAGVLLANHGLQPTSRAATVRVSDDEPIIVDGPFAETKEQLGGYFLIDVPDREAALSWAARCPGARRGSVEVRPVWE